MINHIRFWLCEIQDNYNEWRWRHIDTDHKHVARELERMLKSLKRGKSVMTEWQTGSKPTPSGVTESLSITAWRRTQ